MANISRSRFLLILARQNSFRVCGHLNIWHSCACQKQPCTKIAARYFGNTRSGRPGKSLEYSRKRRPRA